MDPRQKNAHKPPVLIANSCFPTHGKPPHTRARQRRALMSTLRADAGIALWSRSSSWKSPPQPPLPCSAAPSDATAGRWVPTLSRRRRSTPHPAPSTARLTTASATGRPPLAPLSWAPTRCGGPVDRPCCRQVAPCRPRRGVAVREPSRCSVRSAPLSPPRTSEAPGLLPWPGRHRRPVPCYSVSASGEWMLLWSSMLLLFFTVSG